MGHVSGELNQIYDDRSWMNMGLSQTSLKKIEGALQFGNVPLIGIIWIMINE